MIYVNKSIPVPHVPTYKYGDKTVERKKGDTWFQDMGTVLDVSNKGKATAILRGIQFIRAK